MDVFQYGEIQNDIVTVLQAARNASARSANALMTATYWEIGRRIVEFEQGDSSGRNTESPSSSNSPKIWSHVLGGALGGATSRRCVRSSSRGPPRRFCRHRLQNLSHFLNWLKSSFTLVGLRAFGVGSESSISCVLRHRSSSLRLVNSPARPEDWESRRRVGERRRFSRRAAPQSDPRLAHRSRSAAL
jgi:hypothetical protein